MRILFFLTVLCTFSSFAGLCLADERGSVAVCMSNTEKRELIFAGIDSHDRHFWTTVNARIPDDRPDSEDERNKAKEAWYELLGFDPFVPYYEAKRIEDAVKDKTKVTLWKFKGRADFSAKGERADYVFKHQF